MQTRSDNFKRKKEVIGFAERDEIRNKHVIINKFIEQFIVGNSVPFSLSLYGWKPSSSSS
jgi:hypothetical protein